MNIITSTNHLKITYHMKKLLLIFATVFLLFSVIACKHSGKETETILTTPVNTVHTENETTKEVFSNDLGEQMEVIINHTKNTATIRLDGNTYELKKNESLPEYTAHNSEYQYSNIHGNIIFLKRDYDMVLFRSKKSRSSESTKMASY